MTPKGKDIQVDEGGFTRIHNSILEVLFKVQLSSLELRLVLFVIRKTYGFHKTKDVISLSQFEQCGGSRRKTFDAIKNIIRLNIINRKPINNQYYEYSFNKYIETWLPEAFESRRSGNGHNFKGKTIDQKVIDQNGTIDLNDTSTIDQKVNKTIDLNDTHKRNKETIKEKDETQKIFFGKLAEICKVDMSLKRGQIARTTKRLRGAGYTVDDLDNFIQWWRVNDFRGKKGEPPTMPQIEEKIYQSKNSVNENKRTIKIDGQTVEVEM